MTAKALMSLLACSSSAQSYACKGKDYVTDLSQTHNEELTCDIQCRHLLAFTTHGSLPIPPKPFMEIKLYWFWQLCHNYEHICIWSPTVQLHIEYSASYRYSSINILFCSESETGWRNLLYKQINFGANNLTNIWVNFKKNPRSIEYVPLKR